MDPEFIPVFALSIMAFIPVSIVGIVHYTKYKLKVAQIRADAMVRAEEIKAKNQFEIEQLYVNKTELSPNGYINHENRPVKNVDSTDAAGYQGREKLKY